MYIEEGKIQASSQEVAPPSRPGLPNHRAPSTSRFGRAGALFFLLSLSLLPLLPIAGHSQTCPQPFTLRQESCPGGSSTCTVKGASLNFQELDRDLLNIVGLCDGPGQYTWPSPSTGILRSNGSGVLSISPLTVSDTNRAGYRNPVAYGAACTGAGNDTAGIDAAWAALQADGGGVFYIPGYCNYTSGTGLSNNPIAGVSQHIKIVGNGRGESVLTFGACSNSQCIYLGSQGSPGSGTNDGSGIEHLTVVIPAGKDGVKIEDLQGFQIHDVYFYGGSTPLTVAESRFGSISNSYFIAWTVNGIRVTAETYSANHYQDLVLVGASASGSGFDYTKTTTGAVDGLFLTRVVVNGTTTGPAFDFDASSTTQQDLFLFATDVVADGTFGTAGFRFSNFKNVYLNDPWSVTHGTNAAGYVFDNTDYVTVVGGTGYSDTGGSAADVSLLNSVDRLSLIGTHLTGPTLSIRTDATNHDIDYRFASLAAPTFTNDYSRLLPTSARRSSPTTTITGTTKPTMMGLIGPAGATGIYLRSDNSGNLSFTANDGTTVLGSVTAAGRMTSTTATVGGDTSSTLTTKGYVDTLVSGPVADSSITEPKLKIVDSPTDEECLTYESTVGDFEWQSCGSGGVNEGWMDTGTLVTQTTNTDNVSVGVSPSTPVKLSVSNNSTALPANGATGTVLHLGNADTTNTRLLIDTFGIANSAIDFRRSRGTAASRTALAADDLIAQITAFGYGATGYSSGARASIRMESSGIWTDTDQPARIAFYTTPVGSTTQVETVRADSSGNLGVDGRLQLGDSATAASASCIARDSGTDRLYGDKDCNTTKDAGEEFLDEVAGGGSTVDPIITVEVIDEFWSRSSTTSYGSLEWNSSAASAGVHSEASHPGAVQFSTDGTSGNVAAFYLGPNSSWYNASAADIDRVQWLIKTPADVTNTEIRMGFMQACTSTDGGSTFLKIEYDKSTNNNWRLKSTSGGSTDTDSTVAVVASTWYLLEIRKNGSDYEVWINGVERAQHSTNIPSGVLEICMAIENETAASRQLVVDMFRYKSGTLTRY